VYLKVNEITHISGLQLLIDAFTRQSDRIAEMFEQELIRADYEKAFEERKRIEDMIFLYDNLWEMVDDEKRAQAKAIRPNREVKDE